MALARRWARQDEFDAHYRAASARWGVAVPLLKAVSAVESEFNPAAYNPSDAPTGAYGIMQMIEPTARGLGYTGPMAQLREDVGLAIDLGAHLLSELRQATRTFTDSVSAYNGGIRPERGFGSPIEGVYGNQLYVNNVLAAYDYFVAWEREKGGGGGGLVGLLIGAGLPFVAAWLLRRWPTRKVDLTRVNPVYESFPIGATNGKLWL